MLLGLCPLRLGLGSNMTYKVRSQNFLNYLIVSALMKGSDFREVRLVRLPLLLEPPRLCTN